MGKNKGKGKGKAKAIPSREATPEAEENDEPPVKVKGKIGRKFKTLPDDIHIPERMFIPYIHFSYVLAFSFSFVFLANRAKGITESDVEAILDEQDAVSTLLLLL